MISEPNDVASVNVYVSLCVSISMRLYSTVSLVVRDKALYKCTLLLSLLLVQMVIPFFARVENFFSHGGLPLRLLTSYWVNYTEHFCVFQFLR